VWTLGSAQVTWLYGMTTFEEQSFCTEHAAAAFTGAGEVVDIGCWLGSSTLALVRGLERNPGEAARQRVVHAYDLFVWQEWMDPIVAGTDLAGRYTPGESFLDEFERRVALHRDRIVVHAEDLLDTGWDGGPIELAFVDAMKTPELTAAIARDFFPSLVPGAVVVHQDFVYPWCPWIHVLMFRLRHRLEPYAAIRASYGAAFRAVGEIDPNEAEAAGSLPWARDEVEGAIEYASALCDEVRLPRLMAARLVGLIVAGCAAAFEEAAADPRLVEFSADPDLAAALSWCRDRLQALG
jgi:hypothetical protein